MRLAEESWPERARCPGSTKSDEIYSRQWRSLHDTRRVRHRELLPGFQRAGAGGGYTSEKNQANVNGLKRQVDRMHREVLPDATRGRPPKLIRFGSRWLAGSRCAFEVLTIERRGETCGACCIVLTLVEG